MTKNEHVGQQTTAPAPTLKSRALRAGSWVLFGYGTSQALRLAGNLIMTRLLTPEAFGIMAIAMTVQGIVSLCADVGLRQAIIQSPNGDKPHFLNTAWTLEIVRNWGIWVVCLVVAIGLCGAGQLGWVLDKTVYAAPILPAVIAATSFTAVIQGFQSMNAIIAHRTLNLRRMIYLESASQVVGLVTMATMAWLTGSVWSFVVGSLFSMATTSVLTHLILPGPPSRFAWDRSVLHELLHFGKWIWLSSAIGIVAATGDRLLLGAWFAAATLGIYSIAANLAVVLEGLSHRLFSSVSLPALSEVVRTDPKRVRSVYLRMRWVSDPWFIGLAGFLFAAGESIIGVLYDSRYAAAGWMLQWLSFGLLFSRFSLTQNCYLALGRSSYLSLLSAMKLVSLFALLPAGYFAFGLEGAVLGIAFHMAVPTITIFVINHRHGLNSWLLEIGVLAIWPIGWLVGVAFREVLAKLLGS